MALESTNTQNSKHTIVHKVTWTGYDKMARDLAAKIKSSGKEIKAVYGIPRGGLVLACHLSNLLGVEMIMPGQMANFTPDRILICDDVSDSGNTLKSYEQSGYTTATLFYKTATTVKPTFSVVHAADEMWLTFPWEV